jgi:hypothetical protein
MLRGIKLWKNEKNYRKNLNILYSPQTTRKSLLRIRFANAQDFAMHDELLPAILKASVPQ